jgi:hypothetical protein
MLECLAQKGGVCTDGRILGNSPVLRARFSHVSARRGIRAKVGRLPNPRGEVAPGGDVGETTAKCGVGQDAPGGQSVALGECKDAKGNYGFVYHLNEEGEQNREIEMVTSRKRC